MLSYLLAGVALTLSAPGRELNPFETVIAAINEIEQRHWTDAERLFTNTATVTGVPSEEPEKRWTKSAKAFLAEKPVWCCRVLESRLQELELTAAVQLDFRHAHLVFRCNFELLKIENHWKIDSLRFATRRDAAGAQDELKKLNGEWQFVPDKQPSNSLIQAISLTLGRDSFKLDMRLAQINLFGGSPGERIVNRVGWKIRIDPSATPKTIEIEWEAENVNDGLRAEYRLEGDRLTLKMIPRPGSQEFNYDSPSDTLVFKRK